MNFYALDETAVNDWQTWFASGVSSEMLSAQATGTTALLGAATAALALSMTGSSSAAALASATALITLSITGNGVIGAQPIVAHPGYGDMELSLTMFGTPSPWQLGDGDAAMTLTAKYGMPDPVVIPTTYMAAHRNNVLRVAAENRTMLVPGEDPMRVPPRRTL